MPLIISEILVTIKDETQGRSTNAPMITLPTVLDTPIRDMMKAADSESIPLRLVMLGK
jgi:hypothetical protein